MSKNRLNSKARHQHNLRLWRGKQSKLRARQQTASVAAFDGEAFRAAVAEVCERHGVAVCVCLGTLTDKKLFSTSICLDSARRSKAKKLHDLCFGAVVESEYTGPRVWKKPGNVIEEVPQFKNEDGYLCVSLEMENGNWEVHPIHEIQAKLFVPNPENKTRVRHKDGDKLNNTRENLEWC
jgi:hypothetical protein